MLQRQCTSPSWPKASYSTGLDAPGVAGGVDAAYEGRCKATRKREFKLSWREAGPPNHLDDKVDSGQKVVNKEFSLLSHMLHPSVPCYSSAVNK